jgi:hypothetical protein
MVAQRATNSPASGAAGAAVRLSLRPLLRVVAILTLSIAVFALVGLYGSALRDARYLDGWILAGGMMVQVLFYIAVKSKRLSPRAVVRWRSVHVFFGHVLIAVFLSHANFSLPDTALEWALWSGFVLVTASGIFGTYLSWVIKGKHGIEAGMRLERIPVRREELAQEVHAAVACVDGPPNALALPAPPYDAWLLDLYANHLRDFFQGPRHALAHLGGSQRPLKRLLSEIDTLARYVDAPRQERLRIIKGLVIEKDRLDVARAFLELSRGWLFVHVPVTYALAVLTALHGVSVYAFSSGAW